MDNIYDYGFDKNLYRITESPLQDDILQGVDSTEIVAGSLDLGRIQFLPDEEVGFVAKDDAASEIFKILTGGADVGDVIMGNVAGQHAKWDKSAGTFTITGTLTATSGTIGGWSINATSIYTGTEDHAGYTANAGDLTIYSDGTDASIHAKLFYIDAAGVLVCSGATIGGSTISTPTITGIQTGSEIAIQGWTHDMVFSVTDANTVAWASGTITLMNGDTYSIDAGNTDDALTAASLTSPMAAETFIFLDIAESTTVLQATQTKANAVGTGKIMIAICENATDEAEFVVFGSSESNLDGAKIRANSITANEIGANVITASEIYAGTITATQITGSSLSAIYADMGTITAGNITLDTSGYIKGGQTAYNTGTGFFLGYDTDAYKFSVGSPAGKYMTWDGSDFTVNGLVLSYRVGDTLIESADTERAGSPTIYTKIKEIRVNKGGDFRIKWEHKYTGGISPWSKSRIYKNDVALGDEHSATTSYQEFSDDLTDFVAGDKISLWYITGPGGSQPQAYLKNFRIYSSTEPDILEVLTD